MRSKIAVVDCLWLLSARQAVDRDASDLAKANALNKRLEKELADATAKLLIYESRYGSL